MKHSLTFEQGKQIDFYRSFLNKGFKLETDSENLYTRVGEIITIPMYCEQFTENLLCKLYTLESKGKEEPFHLVPLWQIVRYLGILPKPGDTFEGTFIVGVRKNEFTKTLIPSLRLPKR